MIFEWKGGKNTVDDQLSRYRSITSKSLTNVALVPKEAASSFDVVIVCEARHAETIKLGIVKGSFSFPVISVDGVGMHRVLNDFRCQQLNEIFAPSLAIDFSSAPTCHIPVNEKSEDWEVADLVIPKVLEKMLDRQTLVKASSICPSICPLWDNMHGTARTAVLKRVCEVLQQAALGEFGAFLVHRKRNNDCEVDFIHNPVDVHEGKRSGALKRLKNASRIFKERLVSGKKFVPEDSLFDPPAD